MDLHREGKYVYADVGMSTLLEVSPPDPDNPRKHPDDRYPDIIADQRDAFRCNTVAGVESFWLDCCDRLGKEPVWDSREVTARILWSMWVADCPDCRSVSHVWSSNPQMMCLDCCHVFKVRHPLPALASAAIRLLACREIANRNWDVQLGETVDTLANENRLLINDPTVMKDGLWVPASIRPEG